MIRGKECDEISAFVDGEARSPDAINVRIKKDPTAAQYYSDTEQISARLKALPEVQPRSDFSSRVVARVQESECRTRASWYLPIRAHAALAMMLLVGVLAASVITPAALPGSTPPAMAVSLLDEEIALVSRLEHALSADVSRTHTAHRAIHCSPQPAEMYDEQLLHLVASTNMASDLPAAWGGDYSTPVTHLDDAGRSACTMLLKQALAQETVHARG